MKVEFWPPDDQRLWVKALAPGDPFEPGGVRADYRPNSNTKVENGYGRWLTFLGQSNQLDAEVTGPGRITPDRVKSYVENLRALGNRSSTILSRLQELGDMAKAVAPERNWSWINRIASKIRAQGTPARDKRARLVPSDELLTLGFNLMEVATRAPTKRLAAISFRDGLIIALLALRPLRRKNLKGIELNRSLVRLGDGWILRLDPEETKTHVYIEAPWPECLAPALEDYLAVHRPVLMDCKSRWHSEVGNALWVSSHGSPMTEMAIYDQIAKRTREAFGHSINPHLFRDAAATTMAVEDPEHVRLAASLLGHRTFSTTERYYQQARMLSAHRMYAKTITKLWRGQGRITPRSQAR